jgi:hypothetical protein
MKKVFVYVSMMLAGLYLLFLSSCGGDDEMSYENTFNLESLEVNPSVDINDNFIITYGVTTKGFPQFLFDIYLSNDDVLDQGDLKIGDGLADTDTSQDTDDIYYNQVYFRTALEQGTNAVKFTHSFDQMNWEGDATIQENLSGRVKYIIGRFYHIPGLQIKVFKTRLAERVNFE